MTHLLCQIKWHSSTYSKNLQALSFLIEQYSFNGDSFNVIVKPIKYTEELLRKIMIYGHTN